MLKGDEYLLTSRQRIKLNGKILRKDVPKPLPGPLDFHNVFREVVTGFGTIYFIFSGGKFNARANEWSGEWVSLDMTKIASSGSNIGLHVDHHFINHHIIGIEDLLDKDKHKH